MIDGDVVMADVQLMQRERNDFDLVCPHNLHTVTSIRKTTKSKRHHLSALVYLSFFPFLFHFLLSFWQPAWSHLSYPTTNTCTHTHTVSKLQRHPAVGVGEHFQKLSLPTKAIKEQRPLYCKLYKGIVYAVIVEVEFHRNG